MRQMKRGAGTVLLIVLLLAIVGLGFVSGNILSASNDSTNKEGLKLGLDLQGGVSITYEVVGETPTAEQMNDTIYKLQQRIENDLSAESTTTEANVYPVGDRRISVEIPGVTDANAILAELGNPGQLYFIAETDSEGNKNYEFGQMGWELNQNLEDMKANGSIVLTGTDVASSRAGYNTDRATGAQSPVVELTLKDDAAQAFSDATAKALANNESIGIYYDGRFISVPTVEAQITNGQAIINGMESFEAANSLASYIRIGGLDVQLAELQSEVVGAQLGSNAVSTSFLAAVIGLLLVIVFLIAVYRIPGIAASLALILYSFIMVGLLKAFDVTLTLPGIAGIILSIGMAVDANVIIFARIREEIGAGKSIRAAVSIGFKKALSAILDGNITTLIAAVVLGLLGSGTVRGFAITLAMGVIVSMFTALVITRLFLTSFVALGIRSEKAYGKTVKHSNINFIGKKAVFFIISIVIVAAGLIGMGANAGMGSHPLNYSLEFIGGTSTTVEFNKDYSIEDLEKEVVPVVSKITGDNDIQTQKVQGSTDVIIKTRNLSLDERTALTDAMESDFQVPETAISSESIGSVISGEMRSQSIIAVLVSVLCMLIYIWIRFRDIRFGASAVIALAHDVLVVLALFALTRMTVGSAFIACMLTVIGYSINDTIVVFDRVRENLKAGAKDKEALKKIANDSINQTITRSISTSITTALTIIMLLILGVASIREFALPLLIGVIAGTYSSICLATSLWYLMRAHIGKGTVDKEKPKYDKPGKKTEKPNKDNQGAVI